MEGYIDKYRHPKVVVMVNGVAIDAIVDAGFDGDLCLPTEVAIQAIFLISPQSFR